MKGLSTLLAARSTNKSFLEGGFGHVFMSITKWQMCRRNAVNVYWMLEDFAVVLTFRRMNREVFVCQSDWMGLFDSQSHGFSKEHPFQDKRNNSVFVMHPKLLPSRSNSYNGFGISLMNVTLSNWGSIKTLLDMSSIKLTLYRYWKTMLMFVGSMMLKEKQISQALNFWICHSHFSIDKGKNGWGRVVGTHLFSWYYVINPL